LETAVQSSRIAILIAIGGLLLIPMAALLRPASAQRRHTALPDVTPVATTPASRPFLSAAATLRDKGYVEEEYFLSGMARAYDWDDAGRRVHPVTPEIRYVNRIIVRRPSDPARFSGNVEVNVLNASLGVDLGGPTDADRMYEQGDVWIGVTTKAAAVRALKRFDAARYAPLDWSNPAPTAERCASPTIIPAYMVGDPAMIAAMQKAGTGSSPETEDGLVWDMLGQLGLLLKSDRRDAILPKFASPHVCMTGISQSSLVLRTWVAGFHDRYRTRDGKPAYDGYLGVAGPALIRINQCAQDVPLNDPRQKISPLDVPFISLSSEGEMWMAKHTRQPDCFTPTGGLVSYEIAGGSHGGGEPSGQPTMAEMMPSMEDLARIGVALPDVSRIGSVLPSGARPNDLPWTAVTRGAYHNLQRWVREGVKPPQAPGIELGQDLEIRRDAHGNARGGVRTPYVDVPIASYTGHLGPGGGPTGVIGYKLPLSREQLTALYPTPADYLAKFTAATKPLVDGRWISREDAELMIKAAAEAPALWEPQGG
jgi:hypothetical protein